MKKKNKTKKLRLGHTYLECDLLFYIFSKERLQHLKKLMKKSSKKGTTVGCMFSRAVRARGHVPCTGPNKLKQLGRPNFTYAEGLVKF